VADERRRRRWLWAVIATLAYALVVAEAVAAGWSLVTDRPWDWRRFWFFFFVASLSTAAGTLSAAFGRRMSPEAQRKFAYDEETAHAMRTGFLSPDADPVMWRGRIARRIRLVQVLGALYTLLCVTSAVLTALAAHRNNNDELRLWVLAILSLLLVLPLVWVLVRTRRREQRLLARL
jgi:cytochrome bd-type quinol oxidase subunit 2